MGILFDMPVTFAPKSVNQVTSHDPLNPVCPVTIILLFLNIFLFFFINLIRFNS